MAYQDYTVKINFSNDLITGTEGKWNQGGLFDGSSAYLSIPDSSDWDLMASNSDNYTIDLWVKHTDHIGSEMIIHQTQDSGNYWRFSHVDGTGLRLQVASSGLGQFINTSGGEITDTNWHHIALIKKSIAPNAELGFYIDGVQVAYRFVVPTQIVTLIGSMNIGAYLGTSSFFDGNMDEIRVQKSNIFGASPNIGLTDTITIPTSAYTSDSNTKLLLHFNGFPTTDSGNTGHSIINYNVVSELGHSYDLPLVFHLSDPHEGMKATIIKGTRGDGSIIIPGGKRSQEIRVRGKLFDADGYKDIITLMNEMRTNITTDVGTLTLRHLEGTSWITDWAYTVRRIDEIVFPESMRIGMQEYEVSFLVIAY